MRVVRSGYDYCQFKGFKKNHSLTMIPKAMITFASV